MKITKEEYERALDELFEGVPADILPKMKGSIFCLATFDDHADLFLALQLGVALVYEKPLIVLALDGTPVPPKVRQVADSIVEGRSMKDLEVKQKLLEAIGQVVDKALSEAEGTVN
jgi:hypothetical protein